MLRRIKEQEGGYALVTAMLVLAVLTILMAVTLSAGSAVDNMAKRGTNWTRVLGVAESGLDDAVTRLNFDRATVDTGKCPDDSPQPCELEWGEYETTWNSDLAAKTVTVTATGYYPFKGATGAVSRKVQAVYQPDPSFKYALFSASTLDLKNNSEIWGSVYGTDSIVFDNGTKLCGSALSGGTITGGGGTAATVKTGTIAGQSCIAAGNDAMLWADGSIEAVVAVAGDVHSAGTPGCANIVDTNPIAGSAWSCGATIASTTVGTEYTNWAQAAPPAEEMPSFTFSAANYTGEVCYPASCLMSAGSAAQVPAFNAATGFGDVHEGTYVVWIGPEGTNCLGTDAGTTALQLPNLTVTGDLTIITNGRIDLDNQNSITYTGAGSGAVLALISLCGDSSAAICDQNGGSQCSISAKNGLNVDTDLATLFYTTGPMSMKNNAGSGGAIYSGTLQVKNNISAFYNPAIARIIGFNEGYVRQSWQELPV